VISGTGKKKVVPDEKEKKESARGVLKGKTCQQEGRERQTDPEKKTRKGPLGKEHRERGKGGTSHVNENKGREPFRRKEKISVPSKI